MSSAVVTLTIVHTALSLLGIVSGFVVLFGMFGGKRLDGWTAFFLATTVLTSVTGFFFPVQGLLPSHVVGILSLALLAVAILARYGRRLGGGWRAAYVITAVVALYFNVFVLVVQLFSKVPALKSLAPTQSEPPFKVAQLVVLVCFVAFTVQAVRRFHPAQGQVPAQV